jgi:RNA polymerase sigma factor (sigma-70 family)
MARNETPLDPEQARLAAENFPLALYAVRRFRPEDAAPDDEILSAAVYGLILAARGYQLSSGRKFSTYAIPTIRRSMERAARSGLIRVPDYLLDGRPGPARLYGEQAAVASAIVSLDDAPDGRTIDPPARRPSPGDGRAAAVRAAVDSLPADERTAASLYAIGATYVEIGREIGADASKAKRVVGRALRSLRARIEQGGGIDVIARSGEEGRPWS